MFRQTFFKWYERQWVLVWSPEGRPIATVWATTARQAKKQAPKPYCRYMGEIYAEPLQQYNERFAIA